MAGGPWILMNDFKLAVYQKKLNLASDTFKVALASSSSNLVETLTPSAYSDVTGELATSGGYTAGGATASTPNLTGGGPVGTITWDTADVTWTSSGGGFTAKFAFIYDDTAAVKQVIAYCLLDATGANVVLVAPEPLNIAITNIFAGS